MLTRHRNGMYWTEDEGWEYCPSDCEECKKERQESSSDDLYNYPGGAFDKLRDDNGV